jgi:hypothetical protein
MGRSGSAILGLSASLIFSVNPAAARELPARDTLLESMRQAGLQQVRAVPVRGHPGVVNLEGALPGSSGLEIVLAARGDAGAVLVAAADLRRTPLRHTVRVVLFHRAGKELVASRGWVEDLGPEGRARILAALSLDSTGPSGRDGPIVPILPAPGAHGGRAFPPAWLVHFLLRSGRVADRPLSVASHRFPLLSQLVSRTVEVPLAGDSQAFLEQGVPAASVMAGSADLLAVAVRQLDGLAGRPAPEDRYLSVFGRVWTRRDLLWTGFLLWVLLVFRGRPGRWRGTSAEEHGRQMRAYLPGFLFRVLLLLALFLAPVFSVLLFPAAALALVPPRRGWTRIVWMLLGILPFFLYLVAMGAAFQAGVASGFRGGWAVAVLIPATLLAYGVTLGRPRQPKSTPGRSLG